MTATFTLTLLLVNVNWVNWIQYMRTTCSYWDGCTVLICQHIAWTYFKLLSSFYCINDHSNCWHVFATEVNKVEMKLTYLNLPIRLRCENISPPVTNSKTIYKLELSWNKESYSVSFLFSFLPRHPHQKW